MKRQSTKQLSELKETQLKQDQGSNPFIFKRIVYASFLIAFLLIISFYLDLLNDYDLLSLLLGILFCIIIQFILLSYFFKKEMKKYNMDEIGIIKSKIKLIFGQLNINHVKQKNRKNEQDKLFSQDNQEMYQIVMSKLRSKNEFDYGSVNNKITQKWSLLLKKLESIQKNIKRLLKRHESKATVFQKYQNKISTIGFADKSQSKWLNFFQNDERKLAQKYKNKEEDNTSYFSLANSRKDLNRTDKNDTEKDQNLSDQNLNFSWDCFSWYLEDKIKLNNYHIGQIRTHLIKQVEDLLISMEQKRESNLRLRQSLYVSYKNAKEERSSLEQRINETTEKLIILSTTINQNKIKQIQDVEKILKNQFQLRLMKIQLQNLEVKMSRAVSLCLYSKQNLQKQCEKEDEQLEDNCVAINNKITHFLKLLVENEKKSNQKLKKYLQENILLIKPALKVQSEEIISEQQRYNRRRAEQSKFQRYIQQICNFYQQFTKTLEASSRSISEETQKMHENKEESYITKKYTSQTKNTSQINVIKDAKILQYLLKFNREEDNFNHLIKRIFTDKQMNCLAQFTQNCNKFQNEIKRMRDSLRRKVDELNKKRKKLVNEDELKNQENLLANEQQYYKYKIQNYISANKVVSYLPQIIKVIIQEQHTVEKHIEEQQAIENYEFESQKQNKNINQYRKQKFQLFDKYLTNSELQNEQNCFEAEILNNKEYLDLLQDEDEQIVVKHSDIDREAEKFFLNFNKQKKKNHKDKDKQIKNIYEHHSYKTKISKSLQMINKVLLVLVTQWSNSPFFHQFVKNELQISLNRKRPDIIEELKVEYLKINRVDKDPIEDIVPHNTEIYRCQFDLFLNFKGEIAVQIGTKFKFGNKLGLQIKLLIKEFSCPIRVCFTPFKLAKSYVSLMQKPKLCADLNVMVGSYNFTKIPFFIPIIKTYIILKLRKKFLWPKRMTLSLPLSFKSTLDEAIDQRNRYEKDLQKNKKKNK